MSRQREIKFRAWVDKDYIFGGSNKGRMYTGFYSESIYAGRDESNVYCDDDTIWVEPQWGDAKIMQYTGLKDKNGMEIYEGDILEYVSPEPCEDDAREIYIVEWKLFGFEATWHHPHKPNFTSDGHLSLRGADEDMKIIGNIYENPELLEAK